jgi:hypothetical protein
MPANNSSAIGSPPMAMIDEHEAAQAALDVLRAREAGGEHIAQSAIAEGRLL